MITVTFHEGDGQRRFSSTYEPSSLAVAVYAAIRDILAPGQRVTATCSTRGVVAEAIYSADGEHLYSEVPR